MFRYESEMIPVLVENLSRVFDTNYIITEFSTGNGIADLVFTTAMNEEKLIFNDYGMMAMFVNLFEQNTMSSMSTLYENTFDKNRLKKLLESLKRDNFIFIDENIIIRKRKYKTHTKNLFSVEAKLKDWKSGFYQALRYKFFSHKSYLAYPKSYIHRVDLNLLKKHNIGLISVEKDKIEFVYNPKKENPPDVISYYFLSELFAQTMKRKPV